MESLHKKDFPHLKLKHWFEDNKRDFPWRESPSPYAVWVSEVMLQQTQAVVVIPYFQRWMTRFPTIKALAEAPLDEVIKLWEGLGYYSRARNLHQGAQFLLQHHGGELPSDPTILAQVKGLGPYTIGAILSFAFHKKAVALDGNVARVASRLYCIQQEIDLPSTGKILRQKIEEILPDSEPWIMMEALIELGATVCTRRPNCGKCPLMDECCGFRSGLSDQLPRKRQRYQTTVLEREVYLIYTQGELLVQKHQGKKVMSGLYEFPYLAKGEPIASLYPWELKHTLDLKKVTHTFTRYKSQLYPSIWKAKEKGCIEGFEWIPARNLSTLPFSSGHRKILNQLLEDHENLTH